MSWEDQGRQYHMWFGNGTAGNKATKTPVRPWSGKARQTASWRSPTARSHRSQLHIAGRPRRNTTMAPCPA